MNEDCVSSQSQTHVGDPGVCGSQDSVSQQQEGSPLFIPQINHTHESSLVWGEDASTVTVADIPTQNRFTLQMLNYVRRTESLSVFKKFTVVHVRAV